MKLKCHVSPVYSGEKGGAMIYEIYLKGDIYNDIPRMKLGQYDMEDGEEYILFGKHLEKLLEAQREVIVTARDEVCHGSTVD
jgi:hypothetical protein